MKIYLNSAGLWDGVKKFVVVALWVAASGAVASLIAWIAYLPVDQGNVIAVACVALVNALLAGLQKWLSTKSN